MKRAILESPFTIHRIRILAKTMPINERETNIPNWTVPRILAGVAAIILTAFPLLTLRTNGVNFLASWFGAGFVLAPATIAALCWWFAVRGNFAASRARMMYALIGAMGLGGIAFLSGFFGPIILTPDANQGPLLGIFITGPLGFSAGALLGTVYGFIRLRHGGSAADRDSGNDD